MTARRDARLSPSGHDRPDSGLWASRKRDKLYGILFALSMHVSRGISQAPASTKRVITYALAARLHCWRDVEAELRVDRTSLTKAARGMRDAAGVFASDTDVLISAVAGGGNSPWGDGTIGIVMNQINEMVGQACRHLSTRLHQSSTCIEAMREHHSTGEQASTALFPPIDQHADSLLHGARPEPGHSFLP